MDILNWLGIKKQNLIRTTLDSPKDLVILGADVSFQKRGDKYQSYAIPAEDFLAPVARPYKVYTALLTQSGGDDPQVWASGAGPLTLGATYMISNNDSGTADFTNVGAPNNNVGTYFVATGTTPTSWGSLDNGELEANGGAPVVTVLENTIGNIVWTYEGTGQYSASVPNFVQEKVLIFYGAGTAGANTYVVQAYVNNFSPFGVWIDTSDSSTGLSADDVLQETPIEIRVYN
jgi:hypothetical protein